MDTRVVTHVCAELGTADRPVLVRWTTHGVGGAPPRQPHHAYALRTPDGVLLVDPETVAPEAAESWWSLLHLMGGPPRATVLTSGWHERWAYAVRERYGSPVWVPRGGQADLDGSPDHLYEDGAHLPGGVRALAMGEAPGGDAALLWRAPEGERVLFSGDLILGSSEGSGRGPGHWRYPPGMYVWMHGHLAPDQFKARYRRLLDEEFDLVFSAHGQPVPFRDDPKAALTRVLETGRVATPSIGVGLAPT